MTAKPFLLTAAALLVVLLQAFLASAVTVATPTPTAYVRRTYTVNVPFFSQYWWVGFIIMFFVFLLIVLVLYVGVQCHFKETDQKRRRKEIEASQRTPSASSDDEAEVEAARSDSSNPLRGRRR